MTADRRTLLASLGSVATLGSLVHRRDRTDAAGSGEIEPHVEPVFSYPSVRGEPDDVHERTVLGLLREAVPGTAVYLATYSFTRTNVARAIIAAVDRGVDVNVLIDDSVAGAEATQLLVAELGDRVAITTGGAIGDGNNHNKFLLVEEVFSGESNVVWQSSANFTNTQRFLHNTSVVVYGDGGLYDVYRSYWSDMAAGERNRHYNRTAEAESATVYFSPRSDFDTHLAALGDVVPTDDATIRFVNSIWSTERLAVVDRIGELVDGGCTVEVILNAAESSVASHLRRAGATVLEYPTVPLSAEEESRRAPNVHAKTMLVDADVDAGGELARRRLVYTGSQNLSGNGLRHNDDVVLRIEDDEVYCRFLRDWERVFDQGRRLSTNGDESTANPSRRRSAETTPCDVRNRAPTDADRPGRWIRSR